jgi:Putative Actinobacterial Holin-X, holin superfamily III
MTEQPRGRVPGTQVPTDGGDRNIVDLVGRLTQQGAHLAREQVSLMQAEVREGVQEIKAAVAAMAGAAVLGIAGLGVLLMGIAYWIGDVIDNVALGTISVGSATVVIAGLLYASARSAASTAKVRPDLTIETIADTPAAMTGDLKN